MSTNRLFLDIHAIQVLPPSNVNRDDTGSPKTACFGGVQRARVSSQAWKKAMRDYFRNHGADAQIGIRTLKVPEYVAGKIRKIEPSFSVEEATLKAEEVLKNVGLKISKEGKVPALFFIGDRQAEELARAALDGEQDKGKLSKILKANPDIDIALFGRMVADNPELNEDASSQVAHAISTHEVRTEYDYYTAKDDLASEDNAGAAKLDTVEFNSSTLYRYANVALHEFYHQMGEDRETTIKALKLYVEAFSNSMPTGKSNTFANQTLPQALLLILRDDRPVSFVEAYENPVKAKNGYIKESIRRMFVECERVGKFVHAPVAVWYVLTEDMEQNLFGTAENDLFSLLDNLGKQLENSL